MSRATSLKALVGNLRFVITWKTWGGAGHVRSGGRRRCGLVPCRRHAVTEPMAAPMSGRIHPARPGIAAAGIFMSARGRPCMTWLYLPPRDLTH